MNLVQSYEAGEMRRISGLRVLPEFGVGDTLRVSVRVVEGERVRSQDYRGICIARSHKGLGSNFTVRKLSHGECVERVFPLYSPNVLTIEVMRKGKVRRAKIYRSNGVKMPGR